MQALFEVRSFIGSEIAEFKGGKQPFATAQLVAKVLWCGAPHTAVLRTTLLAATEEAGRFGKWVATTRPADVCQVAYGWSRQSATAKRAPEQLLLAAWRDQGFWDEDLRNPDVVEKGLLAEAELKQIAELAMTSSDQRPNSIVVTKNWSRPHLFLKSSPRYPPRHNLRVPQESQSFVQAVIEASAISRRPAGNVPQLSPRESE